MKYRVIRQPYSFFFMLVDPEGQIVENSLMYEEAVDMKEKLERRAHADSL